MIDPIIINIHFFLYQADLDQPYLLCSWLAALLFFPRVSLALLSISFSLSPLSVFFFFFTKVIVDPTSSSVISSLIGFLPSFSLSVVSLFYFFPYLTCSVWLSQPSLFITFRLFFFFHFVLSLFFLCSYRCHIKPAEQPYTII